MHRRGQGGFTLIELLVSLSIFAILALAVYAAFAGGIRAWRTAQMFSETHHAPRAILEEIADDLRHAVTVSGSPFLGASQRLSFLTVRREASNAPEITRVTYALEGRASSGETLGRAEVSYVEGLQGHDGAPDVMAASITAFTLQYASRGDAPDGSWVWEDTWEGDLLPLGVKVTLTLSTGSPPSTKVRYTKLIFLPHHG